MKIIVATDSFKGSLSAEKVCEIIADTIAEDIPEAQVAVKPMADGGEGTTQAIITACGGQWVSEKVMGPLPDMEVEAGFAWFENTQTALVEMAYASGIELLEKQQLDPFKTTTYGTGQLIKFAAKKQPNEILLAIGGSATVDMGVGLAMAIGWKFLDENGRKIGLGGGNIEKIKTIKRPPEKLGCKVKILSDVDNPLYGTSGAAVVYGPQKGANPEMVKQLDSAMKRLSGVIATTLGIDVSNIPGAGAAGGLGAGAVAFMDAKIVSGIEAIIAAIGLKRDLQDADWVITGEGRFDSQSLQGKVVSGIVKAAKQTNTKVAVIAGDIQLNSVDYEKFGITDAVALKDTDMTIEYAMKNVEKLLKNKTRNFIQKQIKL